MGNTLAGSVTTPMVESFIDILQDKGLRQLASKRFGLHKWGSRSTFGYDFSRNQAFKTLVYQLVTPFKEGITASGIKAMDMDIHMEEYVNVYLAHHVMLCLLTSGTEMPQPVFTGLTEIGIFKTPILPPYNATVIAQFQERWTTLPSGRKIETSTHLTAEKEFLSTRLALIVTETISRIDVKGFISQTLLSYRANKRQEQLERYSLFAETDRSTELDSVNATYTEDEQKNDDVAQDRELSAAMKWAMGSDIL